MEQAAKKPEPETPESEKPKPVAPEHQDTDVRKNETIQQQVSLARSPLKLSLTSLWAVLKRAVIRVFETDVSLRCAGVAFFGFLSLFPAVAVGVALYGLIADVQTLNQQMYLADQFLPSSVTELFTERLEAIITESDETLTLGLVISLALALWSGSRGTNALVYALTMAYREEDHRAFVLATAISIGLTIAAFFVGMLVLGAVAVLPAITTFLPMPIEAETSALWLRWPVVALIVLFAIACLYKTAPHRRDPKFRWVLPGAVTATLLWLGGSIAFSFYIENFANYGATFGSIATAAILMLWLYFSAMVFVSGAILNAELELQTLPDTTIGPDVPKGERDAYVADHVIPPTRKPSDN
ncbi:YihY/virulence factor BrkB family protein [Pararhizobium sp. IMCC21322]|uniref:YihY/virulence factor BrkB family protein n=1 Tax=Pararhizobium sp. IMCC21322 TaxID=3067903 RepID=UPI002740F0F3|nr:YihY/virulence factor BrkB family protein [Pararhizobium sp. IMCC21322]